MVPWGFPSRYGAAFADVQSHDILVQHDLLTWVLSGSIAADKTSCQLVPLGGAERMSCWKTAQPVGKKSPSDGAKYLLTI
jgi:hypothetical protein